MHLILVIFSFLALFAERSFAESLTFCKTSDSACFFKSVQSAIVLLKSGNSEYGLRPLDPLSIDKMTIGAGTGPVQLVQKYDNVILTGLSNMNLDKAEFDPQKKTLLISATSPKLTQKSHYVINGVILTLPVTGDGEATMILDNVKFTLNMQLEETKKDGQTYFNIKSIANSIQPGRMKLSFSNLFNGNKLLGDNINKLINDEWQALFNDVQKHYEKSYAEVFKNYAQKFFDKIPADKIFLN